MPRFGGTFFDNLRHTTWLYERKPSGLISDERLEVVKHHGAVILTVDDAIVPHSFLEKNYETNN